MNKEKNNNNIFIAIIVVLIVLVFILLFALFNKKENTKINLPSNQQNTQQEEIKDTSILQNETITDKTKDDNNIEIIYDDIIYSHNGKAYGGVKITNCTTQYVGDGKGLKVFVTFEKAVECQKGSSFATDIFFYDIDGNIIDTSQALYVSSFDEAEIGKQYRDDLRYNGYIQANISAERIARIEFGD